MTTTYAYSNSTGELTGITYSDGTPSVTFAYDRLGRVQSVQDGLGNHVFGYDQYMQLHTETLAGQYYKTVVYEHETAAGVAGRLTAITAGDSQTPSADYSAGYFYDGRGRLNRVSGPGLPAYGAVYGRVTNPATGQPWSELIERIDFRSGETASVASTVRHFEEHRDLLAAVENKWSPGESGETLISRYGRAGYCRRVFGGQRERAVRFLGGRKGFVSNPLRRFGGQLEPVFRGFRRFRLAWRHGSAHDNPSAPPCVSQLPGGAR